MTAISPFHYLGYVVVTAAATGRELRRAAPPLAVIGLVPEH